MKYFFPSKFSQYDQLRTEVNKVLEVARTEKLIGSSLEAKVYLHTLDNSFAARLNEMSAAKNDADTLHRIFITSQVCSLLHIYIILILASIFLQKNNNNNKKHKGNILVAKIANIRWLICNR